MTHNPLLIIPSRLQATRLPNKPLADIHGKPMIVHVWERAMAANIGPVVVAAGDQAIVDVVESYGGRAVLTDPNLPSGSDRVHAAAALIDPDGKHDIIFNVQGDLPTLDPSILSQTLAAFTHDNVDIATAGAVITDVHEAGDLNVVKIAYAETAHPNVGRGLYFSRAPIPNGEGNRYHHIGIYAFKRSALNRFVSLPPHPLELQERLEQLRALADGMVVHVALVTCDTPFGVDAPADLERARIVLKP